ncbi:hypothetical protein DM02DRAFT_730959 [Periconia macrospinosa]|uniref:NAD dependent epimerase/dehydratase n=1 Tax=Periconia macrospinosa TaxID=97972 RepID=A0A2V1DGQ9_9PLEO|nr:hypothetical protein DM02DRAFT_730959 [Periconia macrospinosa]
MTTKTLTTATTTTPSTPSNRPKPVRILHLGFPRTGSVSMMAAYKTLGYTPYHGFDFMAHPSHQILWEHGIDAKFYARSSRAAPLTKSDFDSASFLGPFDVLSDFPVLAWKTELLDWYPDAKVVFVERSDERKWDSSFKEGVIAGFYGLIPWLLLHVIDPYIASARPATCMRKLFYALFRASDREGLEGNAVRTYREHNEWVRRNVPKERLLVYELGSGWEPLCEFLGKEVPQGVEFPWLNEKEEMKRYVERMSRETLWKSLPRVAVVVGCLGVVVGARLAGWV